MYEIEKITKYSVSTLNKIYKKYINEHFTENEDIKWWLDLISISNIDSDYNVNLVVQNEFIRDFIIDRYQNDVENIIKEVFHNESLKINILINEAITEEHNDLVVQKDNSVENKPRNISPKNWNLINTRYTFDNFVVGKNNELAYTVAKNIAENYNKLIHFNPFIIFSPSGLGKTHLVQSIFSEINKKDKNFRILYTTGEFFLHEYYEFLYKTSSFNFEEKYRNVDMLIIDDIQYLEKNGKYEEVQHKFRQIYKNLIEQNKKIILTLDRPIENLKFVTTEFVEEVKQGMIAEIGYPDFENRLAILKDKAEKIHKIKEALTDEVLVFIASAYENSNIRALEGALNKVAFAYKNLGMEINIQTVQDLLDIHNNIKISNPTLYNAKIGKIVEECAKYFGLSPEILKSKSRKKEITVARHLAIYLIKELTTLTNSTIAEYFNKDQASIIYSTNYIISKLKSNNTHIETAIENIKKKLL